MSTRTYDLDDSEEVPREELTRPLFAKINYWRDPSTVHVLCYMGLGDRTLEETTTGIAIDGSGSMQSQYGLAAFSRNKVREVAQVICPYIAQKADHDGGTTLIYWATGDPGEIQPHGFLTEAQAGTYNYPKPKIYGRRTNLLPALKYFADGKHPKTGRPFRESKLGLFVFITDGAFEDLEQVKEYTTTLAQEIENGARNSLKLIVIGLGSQINEQQMIELDNLDTGTSQDLYWHAIAEQIEDLSEIFTELVDDSMLIAENGAILDSKNAKVVDFSDTGVPAKFEFDLPGAATSFVMEIEGQRFNQVLP